MQYAYSNSLFDSLNLSRDVSSLLTKDRGIDYPYDRVTYQLLNTADSFRYILNPAAVDTGLPEDNGPSRQPGLRRCLPTVRRHERQRRL